MQLTVFGASGPTGQEVVRQALARGHQVRAVTRRDTYPVDDPGLTVVRAQVLTDDLAAAIAGSDAVVSVLGTAYSQKPITIYSAGTRNIVNGMRAAGCRRLVVCSSGLTYPPPGRHGMFMDLVMIPVLRHVLGRTLYADMRRMEELLHGADDLDWTVIRPGRLVDEAGRDYTVDGEFVTRGYTSRAGLAAAMLDEATGEGHVRRPVAVTTR